jgi:hypothetical protein
VLYCEECGCRSERGKGWVANVAYDPDDSDDPPCVAVYCPPCAARYFGYRPDVAATYVCTWEPSPEQTTGINLTGRGAGGSELPRTPERCDFGATPSGAFSPETTKPPD